MRDFFKPSLLLPSLLLLCSAPCWAGHPSQGLWVGEVALNQVNEATGAVGNSNTYEFKDPLLTTPTADTAFLRLILHVNGAGQVQLLKSVAVVEGNVLPDGSKDILLITDPSLYANFPGIAKRIATAFFDFGDQQAVTAVQQLIDTATATAVTQVLLPNATKATIEAATLSSLQNVVGKADVDKAYLNRASGANSFITGTFFTEPNVNSIADQVASLIHAGTRTSAAIQQGPTVGAFFPNDPLGGNFAAIMASAVALRDASFYADTRGIDAIVGIVVAAAKAVDATPAGANLATKQANARLAAVAARHNAADVGQAYNRFLAGSDFTGLTSALTDPGAIAALAAKGRGETKSQIISQVTIALRAEIPVAAAYTKAAAIAGSSLWGDTRPGLAINALINAAAESAATTVLVSQAEAGLKLAIATAVAEAFNAISAAPVFAGSPSTEYSGFVTAAAYQAAATTAAKTAAAEAFFQKSAGVIDPARLKFFTKRAVAKALVAVRNQAAVLPQHSLPLAGSLTPGNSLSGVLYLPALAPTNPFMHRQHPDHTEGFAITRKISMTVDVPAAGSSELAGYGVTKLTGTYQEEISGLHKPLGNAQDIGLKTRGTLSLNRLSFADSLNY